MSKPSHYIEVLAGMSRGDREAFLLSESRLPGPRSNLELAEAFYHTAERECVLAYSEIPAVEAPENTPRSFLSVCGVYGLGRLLVEGDFSLLVTLERHARDPRWRIREGVAMALQKFGAFDIDRLILEMERWSTLDPLVQRAAAAALCEPALLVRSDVAGRVLNILDHITESVLSLPDQKKEDQKTLVKALAYCWSVAVVATPEPGKKLMEKWIRTEDKTIKWMMKENLKKQRLSRMDSDWVGQMMPNVL